MELSDNERALLTVYAAATEPLGVYVATEAVLPEPVHRDHLNPEHARWADQMDDLVQAWLHLHKVGLIRELDNRGGVSTRSEITDAGREVLAAGGPADA